MARCIGNEGLLTVGEMGVVSRPDISERIAQIGPRLRAARLARGMTIEEVAGAAGVTKGFVSRLERDDTSVSVANLITLCDVLGIRTGELIDHAPTAVVRRDEAPLSRFGEGVVGAYLIPRSLSQLEVVKATLEPGGDLGREEYTLHAQVEFCHVISGELEVEIDGTTSVLRAGDSVTFPATPPHTYRNRSKTRRATVLWAIVPKP
jgi:transcriptional regulator with XRE-family HTH domain